MPGCCGETPVRLVTRYAGIVSCLVFLLCMRARLVSWPEQVHYRSGFMDGRRVTSVEVMDNLMPRSFFGCPNVVVGVRRYGLIVCRGLGAFTESPIHEEKKSVEKYCDLEII